MNQGVSLPSKPKGPQQPTRRWRTITAVLSATALLLGAHPATPLAQAQSIDLGSAGSAGSAGSSASAGSADGSSASTAQFGAGASASAGNTGSVFGSSGEDGLPRNLAEAKWIQMQNGTTAMVPEGVNNPNCHVTPAHPEAVILIHGTDSTLYGDYSRLGALLASDGWCVYGMDYGAGEEGYGWTSMRQSVHEVDTTIQHALRTSGATQVKLIGFSQGATLARYWAKRYAAPGQVAEWIGLASPTRGGTFYGLAQFAPQLPEFVRQKFYSPALQELTAGSAFMQELNADGEALAGVPFITISTAFDEMMPERVNAPIHPSDGEVVRNLLIQDFCPTNLGGHMYLPYNATSISMVRKLLQDPHADLAASGVVACEAVPLGYGIGRISIVDNLRKFGGYPTMRDGVSYFTD